MIVIFVRNFQLDTDAGRSTHAEDRRQILTLSGWWGGYNIYSSKCKMSKVKQNEEYSYS